MTSHPLPEDALSLAAETGDLPAERIDALVARAADYLRGKEGALERRFERAVTATDSAILLADADFWTRTGDALRFDDDEADAYRDRRDDLLAAHGYAARTRNDDGTATLVCYPADWLDDSGTVRMERFDPEEAVELPLEGPGDPEAWDGVAERNRELARRVREEHGDVHGATAAALAEAGVQVPDALLALGADTLNEARGRFGDEAVYKTAIGTHGGGTWKVGREEDINPVVGERYAFLQDLVERDGDVHRDLRVYVVAGEVVATMRRYAPENDWRTNVALGGSVEGVDDPPTAVTEMAAEAAEVVGLDYAGVDIVEGETGWFVLEVNPTAGFKGLFEATGISPAPHIARAAIEAAGGAVDDDDVARSNLQRQVVHRDADVGAPKVDSAERYGADLNPDVDVEGRRERLTPANAPELVAGRDFVLDCTDNFATRYLVNDACVLAGVPFSHGAVYTFEGQALTVARGSPCYRCVFPEPPAEGVVPDCATAGVLGVLPGTVGCLQATEAVKSILGVGDLLTGRVLHYDAASVGFEEVPFAANPDCPVCGDDPIDSVDEVAYADGCTVA